MTPLRTEKIVSIKYSELVQSTEDTINDADKNKVLTLLLDKIGLGFGSDDSCLGIIAVIEIPGLREKRDKLLPLARELTKLPSSDLDEVVVPEAGYQVGWSHGKEKLEGLNKFDLAKGSFYANPLTDDFVASYKERLTEDSSVSNHQSLTQRMDKLAKDNYPFFAPNVWPPKMPQLKTSFNEVAATIHAIGKMIAKLCDLYVQSKTPNSKLFNKLENVLENSLICKARLLHYFPTGNLSQEEKKLSDNDFSSWCGWHNDHGSLTGLLPGMYLDENGQQIQSPDKNAGLYIKSRGGDTIQVQLPAQHNCLAFQIGETTQIHTGGILQATPHAVRGCSMSLGEKISRESFAVFMEPEYDGEMEILEGRTIQDVQNVDKAKLFLPKGVRTLESRFTTGMNFGEFSDATFQAFH